MERKITRVMAPKECPICCAKWYSGHAEPMTQMEEGLRIWFACGASLSVRSLDDEGYSYTILIKGCGNWIERREEL